jgi:hypothetical protein
MILRQDSTDIKLTSSVRNHDLQVFGSVVIQKRNFERKGNHNRFPRRMPWSDSTHSGGPSDKFGREDAVKSIPLSYSGAIPDPA